MRGDIVSPLISFPGLQQHEHGYIIITMGTIHPVSPVILFSGIITRPEYADKAISVLKDKFGPFAHRTDFIPFTHTNYYEPEMGKGLLRAWVAFSHLIDPDPSRIVTIKHETNAIEQLHAKDGNRVFNLDPGYVSLQNMVLVTTKSYSHRIYLGNGIYGEVTLIYRKKEGFIPLDWTYPDYREKTALQFFNRTREILKELLNKEKAHD